MKIVATVGFLTVTLSLGSDVHACSCLWPPAFVLPLSGSRQIPLNARIFIYLEPDETAEWFNPTGERIRALISKTAIPGAVHLMTGETEIPLEVAASEIQPWKASYWWLAPKTSLQPETRYEVRVGPAGHAVMVSEFSTTTEVDSTSPISLLGVANAKLTYYLGPQEGALAVPVSCGGTNALEVTFSSYQPYWLDHVDSPLNAIERVYIRRADQAYDLKNPLIDVPFIASSSDPLNLSIGWLSSCRRGVDVHLDECTEWCVRSDSVDLAGNVRYNEQEVCVVLSSLFPIVSGGLGERMVCPGEVGPGIPVPPETNDSAEVNSDVAEDTGELSACSCPDNSNPCTGSTSQPSAGCASVGAPSESYVLVLVMGFLFAAITRLKRRNS